MRMSAREVSVFLQDQTVYAVDPNTKQHVGHVTYNRDGTCYAVMDGGHESEGQWGLTSSGYWTRYVSFRGGERHAFFLERIGARIAQAYFADGRQAFLQTPDPPEA